MTDFLPFVSICTPTYNRRPFIPYMIKCFEGQTYPKDRIEWIIIDDGTDPIGDLVKHIPQIKYYFYPDKMNLGKKRNLMHSKCVGDIIVYMDDDDYYPPERITYGVKMLQLNPSFLIAGCSEMYVYFDTKQQLYKCGPYAKYHSTAASFIFRKELLLQTEYDESNEVAEERAFLKKYTIPLIQLDALKTIIVFSHKHNSLNKEKLLENPAETRTVPTDIKVEELFVDDDLRQFYMVDMSALLQNYDLGDPKHKPALLAQVKQIENERDAQRHTMQHTPMQHTPMQHTPMQHTPMQHAIELELLKQEYEKKLADKNCIIDKLMKKLKMHTSNK